VFANLSLLCAGHPTRSGLLLCDVAIGRRRNRSVVGDAHTLFDCFQCTPRLAIVVGRWRNPWRPRRKGRRPPAAKVRNAVALLNRQLGRRAAGQGVRGRAGTAAPPTKSRNCAMFLEASRRVVALMLVIPAGNSGSSRCNLFGAQTLIGGKG
jgi:hypothetical protein